MEQSDVELATESINQLYEAAQTGLDDSYSEDIFNLGKLLLVEDGKTIAAILENPNLLEKYNSINPHIENLLSKLAPQIKGNDELMATLEDCQEAIFLLDMNIALNPNLPESKDAAKRLMSKLVDTLYEDVQTQTPNTGMRAELLAQFIDAYQAVFLDEANINTLIKFDEVYSDIANAYFNQFNDTEEYDPEIEDIIRSIAYPVSSIVGDYQQQQKSTERHQQTRIMIQTAKDQHAQDTPLTEAFYEQLLNLADNYAKSNTEQSIKSFEPTIIAIMKEVGQHPTTDPNDTLTNLLAAIDQRNGETMIYVNENPSRIDTRVHTTSLNEIAQFANSNDDVSLLDAVYLRARADNVKYELLAESSTQDRMKAQLNEIKQDFPNTPLGKVIQEKIDDAARAYPEKQRQQEQQRRAEQTFGHEHGFTGQERKRDQSRATPEWTNTQQPLERQINKACETLKIDLRNMGNSDVESVINKAYRKESMKTHPDKTQKSPAPFQAVNNAHKLLIENLEVVKSMASSATSSHQPKK